ncbi:MAG: Dabb family protein [Planctomycetota bacterium]|nr:Dabb family protein [Planctomycetota bacterium]
MTNLYVHRINFLVCTLLAVGLSAGCNEATTSTPASPGSTNNTPSTVPEKTTTEPQMQITYAPAPEDIRKVEEEFAALLAKIDTIKRFEWGTNNSPEKHSAGFTHCFMVSFDSDAGRSAYLIHPDHLAFVEILKPVLDAPRVLDFIAKK